MCIQHWVISRHKMRICVLGLFCMVPKQENFLPTGVERHAHMRTCTHGNPSPPFSCTIWNQSPGGGRRRRVECFTTPHAKAQVALANCKGRKATSAAAAMCWFRGENRQGSLADFAVGTSRIPLKWSWYGQVLTKISPRNRTPDFPLHGVQRLVCTGLNAMTKALIAEHWWSCTGEVGANFFAGGTGANAWCWQARCV